MCNVLRDDGITYLPYVTELTYRLLLKMTKETGTEDQIPKGYRWDALAKKDGVELLEFYKLLLVHLGSRESARVQAIFADAAWSTCALRTRSSAAKRKSSAVRFTWSG